MGRKEREREQRRKNRDEIREYLPYKAIHLDGVEADDVIGTLTMRTQEFGQDEPIMIVSSDKDFIQLQKYNNCEPSNANLQACTHSDLQTCTHAG